MTMLKVILNGPAIFAIGLVIALAMISVSLVKLKRNLQNIRPKLNKAIEMLSKESRGLPETRKRVFSLRDKTNLLEQRSEDLQEYNAELAGLSKREEKKDEEPDREVNVAERDSPI